MESSETLEERLDIAAEAALEGFGTVLDEHDVSRIERLVDRYEASIMTHLDEEYGRTVTQGDRLADRIAAFGGSWRFIIYFALILAAWIVWNTLPLTARYHFDPGPYILLNLCLSFLAAFQAPIIMMSQNRHSARDKRESIVDFAINYKAEQEVDDMQAHLHRIEDRLAAMERMMHALLER